MYDNIKKHTSTKILAISGYPLLWYIFINIKCLVTNNQYYIEFITTYMVIPYFLLSLFVFVIFAIFDFIHKNKNYDKEIENDTLSSSIFNIGLSIYILVFIYILVYIFNIIIT